MIKTGFVIVDCDGNVQGIDFTSGRGYLWKPHQNDIGNFYFYKNREDAEQYRRSMSYGADGYQVRAYTMTFEVHDA